MRKFTILLLLTCWVAAHAEVLLTEDFDYSIGTDLLSCGWRTTYGTAAACGITVTNGLEFPGYAGSGVGGAALLDTESNSEQAHLPFAQQASGDVYVAFLFQPTINLKKGYFFCLRDAISTTSFNYCARVFIDADYRLGLTFADNQKAVFDGAPLQSDQVYLLVLKYSIVSGSNNDQVALFVYPASASVPASEPQTALLTVSDNRKTDINPSHVVLRSYDSDGWLVIDGIRVATSWSEAVAVQPTALQTPTQPTAYRKLLRNGHLLIQSPTGHLYTPTGQSLK